MRKKLIAAIIAVLFLIAAAVAVIVLIVAVSYHPKSCWISPSFLKQHVMPGII